MFIQPTKLKGKAAEVPFPLCFLNRHVPDRRAAKWDGYHFVSHCLNCGRKIRRKARSNWKLDWLEESQAG